MPYVRTHGKQITIVQGDRDKTTGKVQQRPLFTLYSKIEATAAIGDANKEDAACFEQLLTEAYPKLKFKWPELREEIRQRIDVLPDIYPLRKVRSEDTFEKAMDEFVRQLVVTSPTTSHAGRETLKKYSANLSTLQSIINIQLKHAEDYPSRPDGSFDLVDKFCWRYALQGSAVPDDLEEYAADIFASGDLETAKQIFLLLVRCFPAYAEGYNYLGLIALQERAPKEAVEFFKSAVKYGRDLFPLKIADDDYWSDLNTRPFIRGLRNLALALNQAQQYREALAVCGQLEKESGFVGVDTAAAQRAAAHLNLHEWDASLSNATFMDEVHPYLGFVAAFANYELGDIKEAAKYFIYASLNNPHSAHLLVDKKMVKPATAEEVEDHNNGLNLIYSLPRFWQLQSAKSKKFFRKLIDREDIQKCIAESLHCGRIFYSQRVSDEEFERWHHLRSIEFAEEFVAKSESQIEESSTKKSSKKEKSI